MGRPRSAYAGLVGEWITARRSQLGLTQGELAARIGTSLRTVGNVERGTTAVDVRMRSSWEAALGWPAGAMTSAYARGDKPSADVHPASPRTSMLAAAGISEPDVADATVEAVLTSRLPDVEKIALLRVYRAQRAAFDIAFAAACEAAGIARSGVVQH